MNSISLAGANCKVPLVQNVDKLITSSFKNKTGAGIYLSLNAIFILQERCGLPWLINKKSGSKSGRSCSELILFTEFVNSNSSSSRLRALSAAKAVVYGLFLPQVIDDQVNGTGKLVCMRGQQN